MSSVYTMEAIKKVHASVSQTYTKTSFSSSCCCCCCYYFMCTTGSVHTKDDMDPKNTHTHTHSGQITEKLTKLSAKKKEKRFGVAYRRRRRCCINIIIIIIKRAKKRYTIPYTSERLINYTYYCVVFFFVWDSRPVYPHCLHERRRLWNSNTHKNVRAK